MKKSSKNQTTRTIESRTIQKKKGKNRGQSPGNVRLFLGKTGNLP